MIGCRSVKKVGTILTKFWCGMKVASTRWLSTALLITITTRRTVTPNGWTLPTSDECRLCGKLSQSQLAEVKQMNVKCPICRGSGEIHPPSLRKRKLEGKATIKPPSSKRLRVEQNTIMAKILHREGYSYQAIADFLGYASKRSVQLCLERSTPEPAKGRDV